jgi:hypothetical protein
MDIGLEDRFKELYYKTLRKRDFGYIEKGIRADKESEFLIAGNIEFDPKLSKMVMKRPNLVIGSDRLELYEFLGRRKETF